MAGGSGIAAPGRPRAVAMAEAKEPAPAGAEAAARIQARLCGFLRAARENHYLAGIAEQLDAQRLLLTAGVTDRAQFYIALKTLLCASRRQWREFDALFERFWGQTGAETARPDPIQLAGQTPAGASRPGRGQTGAPAAGAGPPAEGGPNSEADTQGAGLAGASHYQRLATVDFQFIANSAEQRRVEALVERLASRLPRQVARRNRAGKSGHKPDLRKTLRASLQYGGVPVHTAYQQRRTRPPRLVLIVDVSRSMAIYSAFFLRFARGLVNRLPGALAFACHTRLAPISRALRQPDLTRVKQRLGLIAEGWSGGTRLGECLAVFNREHGRAVNRRSIVLLVSDGLDAGQPQLLVAQLARIKRRCRRLVWLNPLLGRPGYEVKTRSMLAVRPMLDLFLPAHNLDSLERLSAELRGL